MASYTFNNGTLCGFNIDADGNELYIEEEDEIKTVE